MKNIPNNDMRVMAEKAKRRMEEDAKETRFKRRCATGEFQDVPAEKVETWSKRNHIDKRPRESPSLSMYPAVYGPRTRSQSTLTQTFLLSGTPSRIAYTTPSRIGSSSTQERIQKSQEFNEEFLRIWCASKDSDIWKSHAEIPSRTFPEVSNRTWNGLDLSALLDLVDAGRTKIFLKQYGEAQQRFKQAATGFAHILGENHWLRILVEFEAALMNAASHPACIGTTGFRFLQEALSFLTIERQKYVQEDSALTELRKILGLLVRVGRFWTQVISQQKGVEYWEPILKADNVHVRALQRLLDEMRDSWFERTYSHGSSNSDLEKVRLRVLDAAEFDQSAYRYQVFLNICEHVSAEAAKLPEAFTTNTPTPEMVKLREEAKDRGKSRRETLRGALLSFSGRIESAGKLLRKTQHEMEIETCLEIKVHSFLFHAEHLTRE